MVMGTAKRWVGDPQRGWMSRAAVLGVPAAAFLAVPVAQGDVVVNGTATGSWVGGDPSAALGPVVSSARLTGLASMTLILKSAAYANTTGGLPGVHFVLGWVSSGGSVASVSISGVDATLPANTTGWYYMPPPTPMVTATLLAPDLVTQYYIGFRVNSISAPTQHIWVGIDPGVSMVTVIGYGSLPASSGGASGGGSGTSGGAAAGTPEPAAAGLALLALGAAGVLRHKRRNEGS